MFPYVQKSPRRPRAALELGIPGAYAWSVAWWRRKSDGEGEKTRTYKGPGYSFEYPGSWRVRRGVKVASEADYETLSHVLVSPGEPPNSVSLQVMRYAFSVTEENIAEHKERLAAEVRASLEGAQGDITADQKPVTFGGLPGFSYEGTFPMEGTEVRARFTQVHKGDTLYSFTSQFAPEDADEVLRGGALIERSFRLT